MSLIACVQVNAGDFGKRLSKAAIDRTKVSIQYDGRYLPISYPNGDVPDNIGVCTDLVIRSYRKLGIDLQQLLHLDIKENFTKYPSNRIWGMNKPDTNIDHRRVPNLQVFFARKGVKLTISQDPKDYLAGDLVTWMLPGNLPHIGIVTEQIDLNTKRPMISHNIGRGPELEDVLFSYFITGHYRFKNPL
ncbi:MAG: DUF1287 domain-containing protein [Kangiellaceae bacterium]|nr:DUF1287 domain-containing protein [Kangiellaceae bacterium]